MGPLYSIYLFSTTKAIIRKFLENTTQLNDFDSNTPIYISKSIGTSNNKAHSRSKWAQIRNLQTVSSDYSAQITVSKLMIRHVQNRPDEDVGLPQ